MPHKTIQESLQPRRFLSYSRRDAAFVERHLKQPGLLGHTTFWDVDQIAPGELWRDEVALGIEGCDEFVLLVSDHSLASTEVAKELALARRLGKTLLLVLIDPLSDKSRIPYDDVHRIDLSGRPELVLAAELDRVLPRDWAGTSASPSAAQVKALAARTLLPVSTIAGADARTQHIGNALRSAASSSSDASPVVLNHGLYECRFQQYEPGIKQLTRYARAADGLAGWYFLALYLPRRQSLHSLHVARAREGCAAIRRSVSLEKHPLIQLLEALYATMAENKALNRVDQALDNLERQHSDMRDPPSEYWRFMDATSESWRSLGAIDRRARALFREYAR